MAKPRAGNPLSPFLPFNVERVGVRGRNEPEGGTGSDPLCNSNIGRRHRQGATPRSRIQQRTPPAPQRQAPEVLRQVQAQGGVTAGNLLYLAAARPPCHTRPVESLPRWVGPSTTPESSVPALRLRSPGLVSGRERSCPGEPIRFLGSTSTCRPGPCSRLCPRGPSSTSKPWAAHGAR